MSKAVTILSLFCACTVLYAQELIKLGDLSNASEKQLAAECFTNGGKVSLFTEELTWNRCGKYELTRVTQSDGYDFANASLYIGGTNNSAGFACKPNTTYEFSIDIKGTAPSIGVKAAVWDQGKDFYGAAALSRQSLKLTDEWVNVKGKFTTGEKAARAGLWLQFWASGKYGPMKFKVGDHVLFDNISIKEQSKKTFDLNVASDSPLEMVKITASANSLIDDFVVLGSNASISAATSMLINSDAGGIRFLIDCKEPAKITPASKGLWSGDVIEIFFGPKKGDRQLSQFVIGPGGETYTGRGVSGESTAEWKHTVKTTSDGWLVDAYIPFISLGWDNPVQGDRIAFNIGRQRKAAKEVQTWSPLKNNFHDVSLFGILLLGNYPDGISREQFEKQDAQRKVAEKNALLARFAEYSFLVAPVGVTDDNSLPYMPDALFEPVEEIELSAAVNEIKPLPLAIANLTDKVQVYRVTLEKPITGSWQASMPETFPGSSAREVIAIRDNRDASGALFDILPKMNEASTITIPAKSASLVWFDINTEDMQPGDQQGVLRIIPLTGKGGVYDGYWKCKYSGEMREIPFTLHVRNIILPKDPARPGSYSSFAPTEAIYQLAHELGQRIFLFDIWSFNFPLQNGKFTMQAPRAEKNLDFAKKIGMSHLMLGYSCWDTFHSLYGKDSTPYFTSWIQSIAKLLKDKGFDLKNCEIEVFDEPNPERFEEVIKACRLVKETVPEINVTIAFGAHILDIKHLEQLFPVVDVWDFWRHGYFSRPEHLDFINKLNKDGKHIRHYTCSTSPRSPLHSNNRMNSWFGEYYQLDSDSMYHLHDIRWGCYWRSATAGELIMITDGGAIPTMRYMAVRQGMTDIKYLAKLREIGKNSPEAQAFLANAAKKVVLDFAHDPTMPNQVREEAAHLILKLQK